MATKRRGMLVKNTSERPVAIEMNTRVLQLGPGEERLITSDEVRDPALRESLQIRSVSIVRPSTLEEEQSLRRLLEEEERAE